MMLKIDEEVIVKLGDHSFIDSISPQERYAAVFEDDGETGYFYVYLVNDEEFTTMDAVHVYSIFDERKRSRSVSIQILWTGDGNKVALRVNSRLYAIFDFTLKRGYCWHDIASWTSHPDNWDDHMELLFSEDE